MILWKDTKINGKSLMEAAKMGNKVEECFFCGTKCEVYSVRFFGPMKEYHCKNCGIYRIDEKPEANGYSFTEEEKFKMACLLNERRLKGLGPVVLVGKPVEKKTADGFSIITVDEILREFPNKAGEFITRVLLNLSRLVQQPFEPIELILEPVGKYVLFSKNRVEAAHLLRELASRGWISSFQEGEFVPSCFNLTLEAWEIIENLRPETKDSKCVFVAMWFDPSMDTFYESGIRRAVEEAGYTPVKMNLIEFNGKICDEIIAEIKRCKFIISDFSGQRGGVYFEAGYAMGQGKTVIFIVKEKDVTNLHFDTRQYNHIVYNSPEELYEKLYNRICATIGRADKKSLCNP